MKSIALVNLKEQLISETHIAACLEFMEGFSSYGYEVYNATSLQDCVGKTILLLSNHNIDIDFYVKLNECNPNAIYIMWIRSLPREKLPFNKIISCGAYTGLLSKPNLCLTNRDAEFPLLFRVNESPSNIGKYEKKYRYDSCYMGTPYKKSWCEGLTNILYHDIEKNKLLTSEERKQNYLSSKIALGFQANANIKNNHVTQRIFEGLAYGCIVISESKAAEIITNGIVVYVENYEKFIEKYNYYIAKDFEKDEEILKKINDGYNWSKQYGTNRFSASLFLNVIDHFNY